MGWVPMGGKVMKRSDGVALVPGGRPIALGLGRPDGKPQPGAGDLIGWTSIEITQAMVGRRVAVFTGIETKSSADADRREEQHNFIHQVKTAGGIAGFAHTPEMAQEIINSYAVVCEKA